jgi:endoglucanase
VIADFAGRVRAAGFNPVVDPLGNVIVRVRPAEPGWPTVAVAAHLDEIGVAVTEIGSGWVRIGSIGGIHETVLPGQVLHFRTDRGELVEGHVSVSSAHLVTPGQPAEAKVEDARVDLLMTSAAELERAGISLGTPGVFAGAFFQRGDLIRAKALDDRAGIAVLLALLRTVPELPNGPGLTVIATVQEEFSTRGGAVAAQTADPDILICLDIAPTGSMADEGAKPRLGVGPVLYRYSQGRSGGGLIPNPRLAAYVAQVAAAHSIPLSPSTLSGGYSDAAFMQYAAGGIASVDLAFPIRNAHTAVEVGHLHDLQLLAELLHCLLADLPQDPGLGRG